MSDEMFCSNTMNLRGLGYRAATVPSAAESSLCPAYCVATWNDLTLQRLEV